MVQQLFLHRADPHTLPELMDAASFVEYSREAQRNSLGGAYDPKPNKELDLKNEQLVATPYMLANLQRAWESGIRLAEALIQAKEELVF